MSQDLIICDNEYTFFEKNLFSYLRTIELSAEEYCSIMDAIIQCKSDDSQVTEKLCMLKDNVNNILKMLPSIIEDVSGMGTEFVSEIDEADSFIY